MKVYTNMNVLRKLHPVLNEMGLGDILANGEIGDITIGELFSKLIMEDKGEEVLQIITMDDETDFAEMPFKEIKEILSSFFTDILELLPESVQEKLKSMVQGK